MDGLSAQLSQKNLSPTAASPPSLGQSGPASLYRLKLYSCTVQPVYSEYSYSILVLLYSCKTVFTCSSEKGLSKVDVSSSVCVVGLNMRRKGKIKQ